MRGTVVKKLKKKALDEKKDYKKLKEGYKKKSQIHFIPKFTVVLRWNDLSSQYTKVKRSTESYARIKTEKAARELLAKRNNKNILTALWYDKNRVATDLLKPIMAVTKPTA